MLAKDVVAVETDFVSVLEHIPATKQQKQEYFHGRGIRVPRTNYESMWGALTERLYHSGAGSAVFDCLCAKMPARLRDLLKEARRGKAVRLRAAEPAVVRDFFFQNGNLRRVGELFLQDLSERGESLGRAAPTAARTVRTQKRYEIALSFAGEDRAYVDEVAQELDSMAVRVFYDAFEEANLLGKDLATHFGEIYGKQASYCVMFISAHYARKAWPQFERQHALARAIAEKQEYILPIRLDDSEVPGLSPAIGYISARGRTPKDIAELLFRKVRQRD